MAKDECRQADSLTQSVGSAQHKPVRRVYRFLNHPFNWRTLTVCFKFVDGGENERLYLDSLSIF